MGRERRVHEIEASSVSMMDWILEMSRREVGRRVKIPDEEGRM